MTLSEGEISEAELYEDVPLEWSDISLRAELRKSVKTFPITAELRNFVKTPF